MKTVRTFQHIFQHNIFLNDFFFQSQPANHTPQMLKKTAPVNESNGASHSRTPTIDLNSSSIQDGQHAFEHLIAGIGLRDFMNDNFEKKPLYIKRENTDHYRHLKVSTQAIDEMLRSNVVEFTKNIDITSYEDGVRETHNPDGRALPATVWDFYRNGCSVREYF